MASRRSFLGGIVAGLAAAFTKPTIDAAQVVDPEGLECDDKDFQIALDKIVDNIHSASKQSPIHNRVIQAFTENRNIMRYYGLDLENIRALTVEQREILISRLESTFTFNDKMVCHDSQIIDLVNQCRGQTIERRPRNHSDYGGPSFLRIPTNPIERSNRDKWWAKIAKRDGKHYDKIKRRSDGSI